MVRVYRSGDRWRVVVDGLAHFDVERSSDAEPQARRVILDRLRAYLPDRHPPLPEAELESFQLYDLILVRVDTPGTGAVPGERSDAGSPPSAAPAASVQRVVTGRRL